MTGEHVIFRDELGEDHAALVTNCWSADLATADRNKCAINLAYVNPKKGSDPYGDQIERAASVSHAGTRDASTGQPVGRTWRLPGP